jgi:heme-degrading monooxygenase HmoA
MYARVIRFVLGPDTQWEADRMSDFAHIYLNRFPGFKGIQCLSEYDIGEYQWIVFWETKDEAAKAFATTYPLFLEALGDNLAFDRPIIQMFQVYETKENII